MWKKQIPLVSKKKSVKKREEENVRQPTWPAGHKPILLSMLRVSSNHCSTFIFSILSPFFSVYPIMSPPPTRKRLLPASEQALNLSRCCMSAPPQSHCSYLSLHSTPSSVNSIQTPPPEIKQHDNKKINRTTNKNKNNNKNKKHNNNRCIIIDNIYKNITINALA